FAEGSVVRRTLALLASEIDIDPLVAFVLSFPAPQPDNIERTMGIAADLGRPPDPVVLERVRDAMPVRPAHALASLERAIALARRDVAGLERARRSFEAMDARPFVARVRCEIGLLRRDEAELQAGLAELERIGDVEQVSRYEQRWKGRA